MTKNFDKILDLRFISGDLNRSVTIREYFKELLSALWEEGEGFSGKRPFGNGGWQYEIYEALVKHKVIEGKFDDCGYLEEFDKDEAFDLVMELIDSL